MKDDISELFAFYDRCGAEVIGHGHDELKDGQRVLIERFIAGQCDDTERRELSAFLLLNPTWIRWIAERVKTSRQFSDEGLEQHSA